MKPEEITIENNKYIDHLMNQPKSYFKIWWKALKIRRYLNKLSPSYRDLMEIIEFLYFLDIVYFYENDADLTGISGSVNIKQQRYTLIIKPNQAQTITINLNAGDVISIEVRNGKRRSSVTFVDRCAEVKDRYDELMFINLNNIIMDSFSKVFFKYFCKTIYMA